MTYFDIRIPGLDMTVVQADGNNVQPVSVDEFRIGVAETYDVIVRPKDEQAYTIFAESMGRSGYARATLAPEEGMEAAVPHLREAARLTMADMGGMPGMDHGSMAGMDHGNMGYGQLRRCVRNGPLKHGQHGPFEYERNGSLQHERNGSL